MKTIDDLAVAGRRVLVRADLNVPLEDGRVTDDGRIRASLPTLTALTSRGARVIVCAHLGRPKGKPDPRYSLAPVAARLGELLGRPVKLAADTVGPSAHAEVAALRPGGLVMLENLRFNAGETSTDDVDRGFFADRLAGLAEEYVADGFGAMHRKHASVYDVALRLPCAAGYLVQAEVAALRQLTGDIRRPYVVVLGGAKVADKFSAIATLITTADQILVGGAMAFPFLAAKGYKVGTSLLEAGQVDIAAGYLEQAARAGTEIVLPSDVIAAAEAAPDTPYEVVAADAIPERLGGPGHRPRVRDIVRRHHPVGRDGLLERPDGRVRAAPVRGRYHGGRPGADRQRRVYRRRRRRQRRGDTRARLPRGHVRLCLYRRRREPGVHPGQEAARPGRAGRTVSEPWRGRLIVLRHGQSEWNAAGVFTGWRAHLTAHGEDEAGRAGALLAERRHVACLRPHIPAAAHDPHGRPGPGGRGPGLDPGAPVVAAQRAALRNAAGQAQG